MLKLPLSYLSWQTHEFDLNKRVITIILLTFFIFTWSILL